MARSFATGILSFGLLAYHTAYAQDESDDACDPNPCQAYGVDIHGGGSYFQNISSTDPFTFVSQFEGMFELLNFE